jgi:signal transduction histidine kinase
VRRLVRLGLRTKFFLYSNTLIVVTMVLVTVLAMVYERATQYEAIDRRGRSIVEAMAIPITDSLMYEDLDLVTETGMIENYITEMLSRNPDVMLWVVVCDPEGRVIHSTDWSLLGQHYDRALVEHAIAEPVRTSIRHDGGEHALEVRAPLNISTKLWGSLAVGFSLEPVDRRVAALARRAVMIAIVLMLGNSLLTFAYVETVIRPILNLNSVMKRAGRGDLSVRAPVRRGDEVGELADAFNRMMDELEDVRELEKVQRAQLAHTEKMVAVGTLAAGVAHEVNNPLSGVLACIESIRDNPDDSELRARYLELSRDGLKRIEHTVANLLGFSRQRDLSPERTSINHSLEHVAELADYQLRRAGVEVHLELDQDHAMVMADHFQMEQLFLNLVLNAIQAMPEGGTLTLQTRVRNGKVSAEVRDTGIGIPGQIRERIFDPFFSTREVGEGTGLGLAVSDSIVAAHGGRIEVESREGHGSVFRVIFDAMSETTRPEHPAGGER